VLHKIAPEQVPADERKNAERLCATLDKPLKEETKKLAFFHWKLEFPDVFFDSDGVLLTEEKGGFDAILGNPPYIATQTSSSELWRERLEVSAGYLDDMYVHFTDAAFQLLRRGGMFGFVVSDTFFTLSSKLRMRELLQQNIIKSLVQCEPFEATVDAVAFVACKDCGEAQDQFLFIQARRDRRATPGGHLEKDLASFKDPDDLRFSSSTDLPKLRETVFHGTQGCITYHRAPKSLYESACRRVFFDPDAAALKLFERLNEPTKALLEKWWDRIETTQKFADNYQEISSYQNELAPGDVTLVGLIADGCQGMRTGNNARFIGYLAGTPQAREILVKRTHWTEQWLKDPEIAPRLKELIEQNGGKPSRPLEDSAAWEASIEPLRQRFATRLGFSRADLYRIVDPELVAVDSDFSFALAKRKERLLALWLCEPLLGGFRDAVILADAARERREAFRNGRTLSDEDFCKLWSDLRDWLMAENSRRRSRAERLIDESITGLKPGEGYPDVLSARHAAVVYNGLCGRGRFLPFRKGDPQGNRWLDNAERGAP
jgi:hypothetical protein